jgi:predicted house-cleaning noncanonical NTP pyrophosphatase (MazG superfamily)
LIGQPNIVTKGNFDNEQDKMKFLLNVKREPNIHGNQNNYIDNESWQPIYLKNEEIESETLIFIQENLVVKQSFIFQKDIFSTLNKTKQGIISTTIFMNESGNKIGMITVIILNRKTKQEVAGTNDKKYDKITNKLYELFERAEICINFEKEAIIQILMGDMGTFKRHYDKRLNKVFNRLSYLERIAKELVDNTSISNRAMTELQDEITEVRNDGFENEKELRRINDRFIQSDAENILAQTKMQNRVELISGRLNKVRQRWQGIPPPNSSVKSCKRKPNLSKMYDSFSRQTNISDDDFFSDAENEVKGELMETIKENQNEGLAPIPEVISQAKSQPGPNTRIFDISHHLRSDFQGENLRSFEQ